MNFLWPLLELGGVSEGEGRDGERRSEEIGGKRGEEEKPFRGEVDVFGSNGGVFLQSEVIAGVWGRKR